MGDGCKTSDAAGGKAVAVLEEIVRAADDNTRRYGVKHIEHKILDVSSFHKKSPIFICYVDYITFLRINQGVAVYLINRQVEYTPPRE